MAKFDALRILDAAANRASEGLRVVEDYARFVLDDAHLTRLVKKIRHELGEALQTIPHQARHALRETQQDVGTTITTPTEGERQDLLAVCTASCERVKQSLRSLEEYGKTIDNAFAGRCEQLRYRWYTLEKALTHTRQSCERLQDTTLCVLIDGRETLEQFQTLARELIAVGVGMLQLRDKGLDTRQLVERATVLRGLAAGTSTLVIVNDRTDVAAATHADGVHLGQEDLPVKAAREILSPEQLIGVSTHSIDQARQAVLDGADYIGVGPTFPSRTKSFGEFPGTELLREVAAEISLPAFAIGGISVENLPRVLEAGIGRVAVSGAVTGMAEPAAATKNLLAYLSAT